MSAHKHSHDRPSHRELHRHSRESKRGTGMVPHQDLGNSRCPIPERLSAKLPFCSAAYTLVYDATMGTSTAKTFYINSPYDPDPSLGGTTAAYFTELGLGYAQYICWGSRIKVYATITAGGAGTADSPFVVACFPQAVSTISGQPYFPVGFKGVQVMPTARWAYIDLYDKPAVVVENECHLPDYLGLDIRGDPTWTGVAPGKTKTIASGSNPSSLLYWCISIYPTDPSVDQQCDIYVEVEYDIEYQTPVVPFGFGQLAKSTAEFTKDGQVIVDGKAVPLPKRVQEPGDKKEAELDEAMSDSVLVHRVVAALKKA